MATTARRELAIDRAVKLIRQMLGPDINILLMIGDPAAPAEAVDTSCRLIGDSMWVTTTLAAAADQFREYVHDTVEGRAGPQH
jgi:hypothetical protein